MGAASRGDAAVYIGAKPTGMLPSIAQVRPQEQRGVVRAFLTLLGMLAAHTSLETARDALFLSRLAPAQLPWVYLAMAVIAVAMSQTPWRGPRGSIRGRALSLLLTGCGLGTLAFFWLGSWTSPATLRALYVWTGVVATITQLQFWLTLGETYTITQAKRLYTLIGLGSLLGAVLGAGLARALSMRWPPQDLLLLAGGLMIATGLGPAMRLKRPESMADGRADAPTSWREGVRLLAHYPYVTRLMGFVLLSTVTVTLADYVFKSAVAHHIPAAGLGAFFASFYVVLNALALLAQLLLMSLLLRTLGLHGSLWVLPVLVGLGAAGIVFGGGLAAALLMKGADGALRPSLHRTGTELLFLPMPDALRNRAKPLIDVLGQRGGQALASVFILGEVALGRDDSTVAIGAALLSVVWIAWAVELRPLYLDLFRTALREGSLSDRSELPSIDLGSLETLVAALNSADDAEVKGAMDLLAAEGRAHLIPALVLYHPSRDVVLRALTLFGAAGRTDFLPLADRLLRHADAEVRASALAARSSVQADEALLRGASADPSPLVRATAAVGLVAGGWVSDEAHHVLDALLRERDPDALMALARAIERRPSPAFEEVLLQLVELPRTDVQSQAARAMAAVRSEHFLPALLPLLMARDVRPAARAAFRAHGDAALTFLEQALLDSALPREIRSHVPRTISRFDSQAAVDVLMRRLLPETDGAVRYKMIRGLGRMAADHPELEFDARILREAVARTLEAAARLLTWRVALEQGKLDNPRRATAGHDLLVALIHDKQSHALERVFRLLGLLNRSEDLRRIYRGLRSPQPKVQAGSRELLESLLRPPRREEVLALIDSRPPGAGRPGVPAAPLPAYEAVLVELLEQPSETMRCLAAYHVGELGLSDLRERLTRLDLASSGFFVSRVIERALKMLDASRASLAHAP